MHSDRIKQFIHDSRSDQAAALDALRTDLQAANGPLIAHTDNAKEVDVTFVWIGAAENVSLSPNYLWFDRPNNTTPICMDRIEGTEVWFRTLRLQSDTTVPYQFVVNDPLLDIDIGDLDLFADAEKVHEIFRDRMTVSFPDPFNPVSQPAVTLTTSPGETELSVNPSSVLNLPNAEHAQWAYDESKYAGTIEEIRFKPENLDERTVSIYKPHGYSGNGDKYPLVVLLDGNGFEALKLPQGIDHFVQQGLLREPVVAAIHNPGKWSRMIEMACNSEFSDSLANELIPLLRQTFHVADTPDDTVIAGISLGGLAASHAAFTHQETFGAVLSCSGSHWWGLANDADSQFSSGRDDEPEWLTRQLAKAEQIAIRWWIDVGRLETGALPQSPGVDHRAANRHLRDVLIANGCNVHFCETPGGHDVVTFRNSVLKGLCHLLPANSGSPKQSATDKT